MLVVEDVLTTGGSTRETMQVAVAAGGRVVGAASIVDRSGGTARFDVPFHALLEVDLPTYPARDVSALREGTAGGEARLAPVVARTIRKPKTLRASSCLRVSWL